MASYGKEMLGVSQIHYNFLVLPKQEENVALGSVTPSSVPATLAAVDLEPAGMGPVGRWVAGAGLEPASFGLWARAGSNSSPPRG